MERNNNDFLSFPHIVGMVFRKTGDFKWGAGI